MEKIELETIQNRIKEMSNEELYEYLTKISYLYYIAGIERDNRIIESKLKGGLNGRKRRKG